jgi:hypothetical protein
MDNSMADALKWYMTSMPDELVDIVTNSLQTYDEHFKPAVTTGGVTLDIRDSKTLWIDQSHWIVGTCWHYIMIANRENFLYDIDRFENGTVQYTSYNVGEYYNWHVDGDITTSYECRNTSTDQFIQSNTEKSRKLSFILQLSSAEEYTGGEVQLQFNGSESSFLPKQKGTICIFDSRTLHRVKKVTGGRRKSLVGWVEGPRWR